MYSLLKIAAIAALAGFSTAANVNVVNKCDSQLHVGKLTNGESKAVDTVIAKGASHNFPVDDKWQGRFWGRKGCTGDECTNPAGGAQPASLAEFTFKGSGDQDFYDVSFVDGYNLPIAIAPINGKKVGDGKYACGTPTCAKVPACPTELQVNGGAACQSACSKWNTEEYCCTGAHNTPDKCPINKYAKETKDACPDVYSYAYDDKTSTYTCKATGYTVTFCP